MTTFMTKILCRLTQAGRPDITAYSPAAVPRPALVLALATVTAAYFVVDRPAADAAGPVISAAAIVAKPDAASRNQSKSGQPQYYGFINSYKLVYEE